MDLSDMDDDGDIDLVTGVGILDLEGKEVSLNVIWVENPLPDGDILDGAAWTIHVIGNQLGYIKDIVVADFDLDGSWMW